MELDPQPRGYVAGMHKRLQASHRGEPRLVPHSAVMKRQDAIRCGFDNVSEQLRHGVDQTSEFPSGRIIVRYHVEFEPVGGTGTQVSSVESQCVCYVTSRRSTVPVQGASLHTPIKLGHALEESSRAIPGQPDVVRSYADSSSLGHTCIISTGCRPARGQEES